MLDNQLLSGIYQPINQFLYLTCRSSHIETHYAQTVTASEMNYSDWMLSSNLKTQDSVATHIYAYTSPLPTYRGIFMCTNIWWFFALYWLMKALYRALLYKITLLLDCQLYPLPMSVGIAVDLISLGFWMR